MPVYEYRCRQCEQVFEYQQRMVEPPKTVCESCAGELERLISRSSFSFKGGGWYKDLYSSSKPSSGDGGGSTSGGSTSGGSSGSSSSGGDSGGSSSDSGSSSGSSGAGSSSTAAAGPAK